jgi:hypothetical protein
MFGQEGSSNHPGLYNSAAELDYIRKHINGEEQHIMKLGWEQMLNSVSSSQTGNMKFSSLDWQPHAVDTVNLKNAIEKLELFDDCRAGYAHALQWVVAGDQRYAGKAIEIFNAWSICKDINVKNRDVYHNLYTSWIRHYILSGAEMIRYYKINGVSSEWQEEDINKFLEFCKVLERISLEWKGYGNGVKGGHNQTDYNLFDLHLDGEDTPKLLKGMEFAAITFIRTKLGLTILLSFNPEFANKTVRQYSEIIRNYYRYLSPQPYSYNLTNEVNLLFREDSKVDYKYVLKHSYIITL